MRLDYQIITNASDFPETLVESLAPQHRLILSPKFASVLEQGIDGLKVLYVLVKSGEVPITLIFLVETQVNSEYRVGPLTFPLRTKFLLCGHPIISADCGISMPDKQRRNRMLPQLLRVLDEVAKELHVSAVLIRDIDAPRTILEEQGFFTLPVQPVMGMTNVDRWNSFAEYLSSMETKYRKKVVNARRKLEKDGIIISYEVDLPQDIERLHELYLTVARRVSPQGEEALRELSEGHSTFIQKWQKRWRDLPGLLTNLPRRIKARELRPEFFSLLTDVFREHVDIILLRKPDGIVAYTVNFNDGDVYYSLFSGMDYKGDVPTIYRTLLSSKIECAIGRKVRTIEFGRISLLTKAELGAGGRPLLFCAKVLGVGKLLNPIGRFLSGKAPALEAPVRHVFSDLRTADNSWYKDNWSDFYAKRRIVNSYDSKVSLLGVVKGGQENLHRKAIGMLDLCAGSNVIDLCCGTGGLALALAKVVGPNGRVCAVDLSREMLSRGQLNDAENKVDFKQMDALHTGFVDETFDAVTIVAALHELPAIQRGALLAEARRILKAGGKLLVGEHFVSENPLERLVQTVVFHVISKQPERVTFNDLIRNGVAREVTGAGFKITGTQVLPLRLFYLLVAEKTPSPSIEEETREEQAACQCV